VKNPSWLKANHAAMSGCEADVILVKPEDSALGWSRSPCTRSVLKGKLLLLLHSTRIEQQKVDAQGTSRQAYAARKMRDLQSKSTKDGIQNELQQASQG